LATLQTEEQQETIALHSDTFRKTSIIYEALIRYVHSYRN